MTEEPRAPAEEASVSGAPRLLSAMLYCERCERPTPHRILRLARTSGKGRAHVRGVARCKQCRWTHPFEEVRESPRVVSEIVSEGPTSRRRTVEVPPGRRLQVGSGVPWSTEPLRILRIDTRSGDRVSEAVSDEVATLWVQRDVGVVVPVSIVEGRRTRSVRRSFQPDDRLAVGAVLSLGADRVEVVALRARGANWRRPGDEFPARVVQRVYARRAEMPPAGRSAWRRDRARPSSRVSSTSTSARRDSGPGVRTARRVPRRPKAEGGATVQSSSPA